MQYYGAAAEVRYLIGLIIFCFFSGYITGYMGPAFLAGTVAYICYHLFYIQKLLRWLQHRRLEDVPHAKGLWGQVFDYLIRQKRLEIREKNRLKSVIDRVDATTAALKDAIILLDKHNDLTWWNQATEHLLDLKPVDIGHSIINYIRHPKFVNYLEFGDYELPLALPSPRHQDIQLEFQLTRFGAGEALLVVRDVTRLYKLEEMRKDFVANVSHELRTPLTVIRGYLETLEDSLTDEIQLGPNWGKAILQMQQQAARMTTLINDLTMLSKLETDRANNLQQPVMIRPILEMICNEAMAISGSRKHKISLNCDLHLSILGNDRELHSAFSNLVTNAVKYSPPEKTIEISANINLAGHLEVSVTDQGVGIEQQHISRLTERFYRVDSSRSIETGGTGLGLAIVKHVLIRHEARLQIQSEYGKGSTFSCIFPSHRVIVRDSA